MTTEQKSKVHFKFCVEVISDWTCPEPVGTSQSLAGSEMSLIEKALMAEMCSVSSGRVMEFCCLFFLLCFFSYPPASLAGKESRLVKRSALKRKDIPRYYGLFPR